MTAPEVLDGRRVFPTEEAALKAAARQIRIGIWTGCQHKGEGWVLLFDAQADRGET